MGQDGHDRGAKVVGSAYADLGVEVTVGPLCQTPGEAAALKSAGRGDIRVVAGGVIPAQNYDFLRTAGTAAIYGPGTNLVTAAADLLRLLGHNLPPRNSTELRSIPRRARGRVQSQCGSAKKGRRAGPHYACRSVSSPKPRPAGDGVRDVSRGPRGGRKKSCRSG